jgi:hypothetical protein
LRAVVCQCAAACMAPLSSCATEPKQTRHHKANISGEHCEQAAPAANALLMQATHAAANEGARAWQPFRRLNPASSSTRQDADQSPSAAPRSAASAARASRAPSALGGSAPARPRKRSRRARRCGRAGVQAVSSSCARARQPLRPVKHVWQGVSGTEVHAKKSSCTTAWRAPAGMHAAAPPAGRHSRWKAPSNTSSWRCVAARHAHKH